MNRSLARSPFAIFLPALFLACSTSSEAWRDGASPLEEGALRRAFPDHAARVLDGASAFAEVEDGFAIAPHGDGQGSGRAALRGLSARLPRAGDQAVRFELPGGLAVRVFERGLAGGGALAGRAVAYARAGGTSYWAATATEYEEWLSLAPGAATAERPAATWDVEGGELRAAGADVEILDEAGVARVRVAAPEAYTASGRRVEPSLRVHGGALELWVDAGGEAVLVDPSWTATGNLKTSRGYHTATLLPNGKVFVAAGLHSYGPCFDIGKNYTLPTPEIYDPASGVWSNGAAGSARQLHTATLLASGLVLIAGGTGNACGGTVIATAQLYNPGTNTWSAAPALSTPRVEHTATRLQDGRVLVVGGLGGGPTLATTEIYDPATNTWSAGAAMGAPHHSHFAGLLLDGRVLVVGGFGVSSSVATAEIYNPTTNTWAAAASLGHVRRDTAGAVLADGRVLVAGGWDSVNGSYAIDATAEIYDPAANTWSTAAPMPIARREHAMIPLAGGRVLVAGGIDGGSSSTDVTTLYNPLSNTWSSAGSMPVNTGAAGQTLTLLPSGKVLVAGGFDVQNTLATAELFDPGASLGVACAQSAECASGFCVDGVCCDTACDAGACDACSIAGGAPTNGTCAPLSGTPCDDLDACTSSDSCQSGACAGAPVACAAQDQCHAAGTCDPATGTCSNPAKADGSGCDDGSVCTSMDGCLAGICKAGSAVACAAMDECHEAGSCDPQAGCSNPAKSEGTPCSVGTCVAGTCTPPASGSGGAGGTSTSSASSASSTSSASSASSTSGAGGAGGAGGAPVSSSSASSGEATTSSGGGTNEESGCGCSVAGEPTAGGLWITLGLVMAAGRRARKREKIRMAT